MPHAGTSLRALLEQVWLARARYEGSATLIRGPPQPDLLPCAGADGRHLRGSMTLARPLCDGHSPLATTPRADKTSGYGGNAECRSERSIPRRAACIATCVDFILIPFSFALNP